MTKVNRSQLAFFIAKPSIIFIIKKRGRTKKARRTSTKSALWKADLFDEAELEFIPAQMKVLEYWQKKVVFERAGEEAYSTGEESPPAE